MKVKDGQLHNWLGGIRESIFRNREGEDEVVIKKKKKAIRSLTRTIGDKSLLDSPLNRRLSRSTSDISHLLAVTQKVTFKTLTHY